MLNTGLAAVHAAATISPAPAATPAPAAAAPASFDGVSRAQHDAAIVQARTEGASAERARIQGILTHDEARGRDAFAQVYAFETGLSVDAAAAALKTKPKADAPRPGSRLDGLVPQPRVAVTAPAESAAGHLNASQIYANRAKAQSAH